MVWFGVAVVSVGLAFGVFVVGKLVGKPQA